jgi:DNA-directed RNA polymerase specialized sigma24 family protein
MKPEKLANPPLSADATVKPIFWDKAVTRALGYLSTPTYLMAEDVVQTVYLELLRYKRTAKPELTEADTKKFFKRLKQRCMDCVRDYQVYAKWHIQGNEQLMKLVKGADMSIPVILDRVDRDQARKRHPDQPSWIFTKKDVKEALVRCANVLHKKQK